MDVHQIVEILSRRDMVPAAALREALELLDRDQLRAFLGSRAVAQLSEESRYEGLRLLRERAA